MLKHASIEMLEASKIFETEPGFAGYEKRNITRKMFDRQTWVEERALRQIRDTISNQAILGSIIGGAVLVTISSLYLPASFTRRFSFIRSDTFIMLVRSSWAYTQGCTV